MRLAANPGISTTQLSDRIGLNKGQVSRAMVSLTARGLVRSDPHPIDSRKTMLSLTPKGEELHQNLMVAGFARHTEFFESIDVADLEATSRVLGALTDKAHEFLLAEQKQSRGSANTVVADELD